MEIIIDADVIICAEKGGFDLSDWLAKHPDDDFALAAITVAELWHGVERATGSQRRTRIHFLEEVVLSLPVFSYTEEIAYVHAKLWAQLAAAGKMTGYYDLIVAATAVTRGSAVATFNTRHFSAVTGLKVIEPK